VVVRNEEGRTAFQTHDHFRRRSVITASLPVIWDRPRGEWLELVLDEVSSSFL
jgi:hypothetical protein